MDALVMVTAIFAFVCGVACGCNWVGQSYLASSCFLLGGLLFALTSGLIARCR